MNVRFHNFIKNRGYFVYKRASQLLGVSNLTPLSMLSCLKIKVIKRNLTKWTPFLVIFENRNFVTILQTIREYFINIQHKSLRQENIQIEPL